MKKSFAIDIGKGDVKVYDGSVRFKFPSAISLIGFNYADFAESPDTFEFEGKKYRVGDKRGKTLFSTKDKDFLVNFAPLLIEYAINIFDKKYGKKYWEDVSIFTGLSINEWSIFEEFGRRIKSYTINGQKREFKKIKIYAQGQGVFYEYKTTNSLLKDSYIVVVDIGYNTLDVIVFENGIPIVSECFATTDGINIVIDNLRNFIKNSFDIDITEQFGKYVLFSKKIKVFGKEIDISKDIEKIVNNYRDYIINVLQGKNKSLLAIADKVIISGGGAYYIEGMELPENFIFSNKPYEYSNVVGYYNFSVGKIK